MAFFKASASDIERFNKYFRSTDPSKCWEWNGAHHPKGYGTFRLAKTSVPAHRFAYALTHNMFIPDGMVIDHICHNRSCVNSDHLRAVTVQENSEYRVSCNKNSKSGIRGVYWRNDRKAWQVEVIKNRKAYKRGPFKTLARAEAAATRLREELGFLTGFGMKETQCFAKYAVSNLGQVARAANRNIAQRNAGRKTIGVGKRTGPHRTGTVSRPSKPWKRNRSRKGISTSGASRG